MKTIIHVNTHIIRGNQKANSPDERRPPLTIRQAGRIFRRMEVDIPGPSKVRYEPDCPLKCGARVWIETDMERIPDEPDDFKPED